MPEIFNLANFYTPLYVIIIIAGLLVLILGIFLIRASYSEVKRKEESEKLLKELTELNLFLEERIRERTAEIEEERTSLEIKVRARTQELRELAQSLDEKVKEKTEELHKKIKELEESRISLTNILEDVEISRERAEEEKNKTLAILENFTDGVLVFDKENKLTLINPRAKDFFQIKSSEDIIGNSLSGLSQLSNLKPLTGLLGKEIKELFRKELLIKENFILEVSTLPIIRGKEKTGTLMVLHDISREKMIERMKTEFVSIAAHQLRTPLSAIKWTIRMLLDGDLGKITPEQADFLEKTYKSNERMILLINDLLNVTRIEEGRYLYKPTLTALEPIIQSVIKSYQEVIKKKKLKLQFQKPEKKLPKALVDVEKIKLAIQNLLDNAIRYTPSGGRVTISLNCAKKNIELSIEDSGIGISEDQKERVFTKFFRGANVIRVETEGTGLGLFIAKNIIDAHKGKIWFTSEEGKGSTFYFTLPFGEK